MGCLQNFPFLEKYGKLLLHNADRVAVQFVANGAKWYIGNGRKCRGAVSLLRSWDGAPDDAPG